jgi:hypothetical protein
MMLKKDVLTEKELQSLPKPLIALRIKRIHKRAIKLKEQNDKLLELKSAKKTAIGDIKIAE